MLSCAFYHKIKATAIKKDYSSYLSNGYKKDISSTRAKNAKKEVPQLRVCVSRHSTGGDGEIRTLEPVRANAFRVRPVMTTSIRLRIC